MLDFSKMKEFAEDNSKFDKNGEKFTTKVENAVGKEVARYEQFLLFPLGFQKTCSANTSKQRFVWKGLKDIFQVKLLMP